MPPGQIAVVFEIYGSAEAKKYEVSLNENLNMEVQKFQSYNLPRQMGKELDNNKQMHT